MHKKHKIYNKTTQTKQQQKNTHTVLSLDSSDNQHDTSSLAKSLSVTEEIQLFKLRIIYQQYISKMLSILKIVHTRPNVSSRQLPPYSNSGKLLTTDSFTHAYWHVTAIIQTIKLCTVRTARCLDINCSQAASRTWSHRHVTH